MQLDDNMTSNGLNPISGKFRSRISFLQCTKCLQYGAKDTAIQIALKILTLMDDSHFNSLTITKVKSV